MNRIFIFRINAVVVVLLLLSIYSYAQTCEVDKESIKGIYTGDCKKGKAHGKGKSVGVDTYDGSFRNGLPDGEGIYTWNNKNVFEGKFVKGLMDGRGKMTYKQASARDSILEGFWRKGLYVGKHENPWQVHSKTGSVRSIDVEYSADVVKNVKIIITTSVGQTEASNFVTIKGSFERVISQTSIKTTESNLTYVTFPFHIKFDIGREQVEIEFFEPGRYIVNISLN